MPAAIVDYDKVTLLRVQGMSYDEIATALGYKPETVRSGMIRKGLHKNVAQIRAKSLIRQTEQIQGLSERSKSSRNALAIAIEKSAKAIADTPIVGIEQLQNTPARQGVAGVIKTLVDAASTAFNWSNGANTLVQVNVLNQVDLDDQSKPIDVDIEPAK
jgi:hypothetical protein